MLVRQMPRLIIRGSLAKVTMAGLSDDQIVEINRITKSVVNHPELRKSRSAFIKKLSQTIKSDYRDDPAAADAEYNIAIWRAVVSLMHHSTYNFTCTACESSHYLTKRSKPKAIDRIQIPCPNCKKCKVTNPGSTKHQCDDVITYEEYLNALAQPGFKCDSTIVHEDMGRKYLNQDDILNDPEQLRKFFSEFIWNYFRQQLNENKREQKNVTQQICGRADKIIASEMLSLCSASGVEFNHSQNDLTSSDCVINIKPLATPPEFSIDLSRMISRAKANDVIVDIKHDNITIKFNDNSKYLTASIISPEFINMVDGSSCISGTENTTFNIDHVGERGTGMCIEDHVSQVETTDVVSVIRQALPTQSCQMIFDIITQSGDTHLKFSELYGDKKPTNDQIAAFLRVSSKEIPRYKNDIKTVCALHGLGCV